MLTLLFFLVSVAFYFLPAIIAHRRSHREYLKIFLVNLLLGWSLIGWVVALVWALATPKDTGTYQPAAHAAPTQPMAPSQQMGWSPVAAPAPAAGVRRCAKCGAEIVASPGFCANCGSVV